MKTTLQYRILNLSGVTTHHVRHFTDGVEQVWQGRTLQSWLDDLRRPWVSNVTLDSKPVSTAGLPLQWAVRTPDGSVAATYPSRAAADVTASRLSAGTVVIAS